MKRIITKDGSITFHSDRYDENYHSLSGAAEEAFKKYAEPSELATRAEKDRISILDVCFGLGYNTAAALEMIWAANPDCEVFVVGLENDTAIMKNIRGLNPPMKSYRLIKKLVHSNYYHNDGRLKLKVLVGDARKMLPKLTDKFDIVFHDPFSPKKCPELWTEEFFSELRKHINPGGVMTTYSCARKARENMKKAGFAVTDGPCVGRRAPSTIALPLD